MPLDPHLVLHCRPALSLVRAGPAAGRRSQMLTPRARNDATQTSPSDNQGATRCEYRSYQAVDTGPLPDGRRRSEEREHHAAIGGNARRHRHDHGMDRGGGDGGPECFFCGDPAKRYKPLNEGTLTSLRKLWCRPCETTWVA